MLQDALVQSIFDWFLHLPLKQFNKLMENSHSKWGNPCLFVFTYATLYTSV